MLKIQFNIFKNDSRKYIKSNVNNGLDLKTKNFKEDYTLKFLIILVKTRNSFFS